MRRVDGGVLTTSQVSSKAGEGALFEFYIAAGRAAALSPRKQSPPLGSADLPSAGKAFQYVMATAPVRLMSVISSTILAAC